MQGKTVVVTGATNGIGEAITEDLARQGATLIIVGRNKAKCSQMVGLLTKKTGNPNITSYVADLSAQREVRSLANRLKDDLTRVDVLINNAGTWFTERKLSVDGIEMTWALNHLNYFLLTQELDSERCKDAIAVVGDKSPVHRSDGVGRNDDRDSSVKTVLITGAASGSGKATLRLSGKGQMYETRSANRFGHS